MNKKRQAGFVLISALIFLVLMIYLGLAMFRGFGLDEMMAGNLREKSRATESAQAAIDYAEWWLIQSNHATNGTACTVAGAPAPQVCSGGAPSLASSSGGVPSLPSYANFSNATMNTTVIPVNTSGGAGNYYANPIYSIYYLGDSFGAQMYSITAQSWGGNKNAVATIQTVYQVTSSVKDAGGP